MPATENENVRGRFYVASNINTQGENEAMRRERSILASPVRRFRISLLAPIIAMVGLSAGLAAPTQAAPMQAAAPAPAIHFDGSPGTDVPPSTLGPYTMTPFSPDNRSLFASVTTIPAPNGDVRLSPAADHLRVGQGWLSWSNGYGTTHGSGDVYAIFGTDQVVMTMPPDTGAVYFYTESNVFGPETFTATAQDGTTSGPVVVTSDSGAPGLGAKYFGFYGTGGALPQTITLTCTTCGGAGFAVGEFGDAVGPAGLLNTLLGQVQGVGPGHSLADKVQEALNDVNAGDISGACGTLGAFIHEVNAQTGKKISAEKATELIDAVQPIEAILGC